MVGGLSMNEGTRILEQQLLLTLVSDEVLHLHAFEMCDPADLVRGIVPAEDDMTRKLSIAIACIVGEQRLGIVTRGLCCLNPREEEVLGLVVYVLRWLVVVEQFLPKKFAGRLGEERVEELDVLIERLTQAASRRKSRSLHGL